VADVRAGRGYEGIEGFQPRDAKVDELDDESPLVGEFDPESGDVGPLEDTQVDIQRWTAENKVFEVKSDEPVTLALKLLNYPAWDVRVDGKAMTADTARQTGQLLIPLDAGTHHVEVQFRRTRDRTIGLVLSAVSVMALLVPIGLTLARARRRKSS